MVNTTLYVFICLLTGHIAGDFLLQTRSVATQKNRWVPLTQHAAIVAGLSYLLCGSWRRWEIPLLIFLTHAAIDRIKTLTGAKTVRSFVIDQLAHMLIVFLTTLVVVRFGEALSLYWFDLFGAAYVKTLLFVAGGTAAIRAGGFLIGLAVQPLLDQIENGRPPGRNNSPADKSAAPGDGLKGGGRLIGELERALVFLFVMMGQPTGIGFLITAKSIFRFGDIKERRQRMLAEYIIIGTLMSFAYAIFVSYVTKILMDMV